jgi:hypothetical protein
MRENRSYGSEGGEGQPFPTPIIVARERKGRTVTTVARQEADGVAFVAKVVAPGSELHADEASHWDALHAKYQTSRINHQIGYSIDGACRNQAESFLGRSGL